MTNNNFYAFTFDVENRVLTANSASQSASLTYDPLGRLQTNNNGSATSSYLFDGDNLVEVNDSSGATTARYVPGPGTDEPLVLYQGATLNNPRWLVADTQGSIVGYADASGNSLATYTYDPSGYPAAWQGAELYSYTGQLQIPTAHLYYYKARMYEPGAGRFLQTDPIGYDADMNLYDYADNDPINGWDPSGLVDPVVVVGHKILPTDSENFVSASLAIGAGLAYADPGGDTTVSELIVTASKRRAGAFVGNSPQNNQQPKQPSNSCKPANNLLTRIANGADNFSNAASAVSLVSGGAALVTSETIVGGVTFGTVSFVSGAVSVGASGVGAIANYFGGRRGNAAVDAFGAAFGGLAGFTALKAVAPTAQFLRGAGATVVTQAASSICPG